MGKNSLFVAVFSLILVGSFVVGTSVQPAFAGVDPILQLQMAVVELRDAILQNARNIEGEIGARILGDQTLQENLNAEAATRAENVGVLEGLVDENSDGVVAEEQARIAADENLQIEIVELDLRDQSCSVGQVVTGVDANGDLLCAPDAVGDASALQSQIDAFEVRISALEGSTVTPTACDANGSGSIDAIELISLTGAPSSDIPLAQQTIYEIEDGALDTNNNGVIDTPGELTSFNIFAFELLPACTITGIVDVGICNGDGVIDATEFEALALVSGAPLSEPAQDLIDEIESTTPGSNLNGVIDTPEEFISFGFIPGYCNP